MTEPRIRHGVSEPSTTELRRQRDHAASFRPDPVLERLTGLQAKADAGNQVAAAELAAMAPSTRMALGYFATARSAAVTLGLADEDGQLTGKQARQ